MLGPLERVLMKLTNILNWMLEFSIYMSMSSLNVEISLFNIGDQTDI